MSADWSETCLVWTVGQRTDNDGVIPKAPWDVTTVRTEECRWPSPLPWVGLALGDIRGNRRAIKGPYELTLENAGWHEANMSWPLTDGNPILIPLHREHPPSLCVELWTVGCPAPFSDTASCIVCVITGIAVPCRPILNLDIVRLRGRNGGFST